MSVNPLYPISFVIYSSPLPLSGKGGLFLCQELQQRGVNLLVYLILKMCWSRVANVQKAKHLSNPDALNRKLRAPPELRMRWQIL